MLQRESALAHAVRLRSPIITAMDEPPIDAPDEDWLVWADAMQQIGDPRGELIALDHAPAYVKAHADALFGRPLGRHVRKGDVAITKWRRCDPDELELRVADEIDGPQLVVDALAAPCADTLRGLTIAGVTPSKGPTLSLARTLGWLRESRLPPSLVSLALVDDRARAVDHLLSRDIEPGENLVAFGPLAELWRAFAELERLTMVVADPAQIQFQVIRLPKLTAFTLHALTWANGLGDMLALSQWPALRALELRCCDGFFDTNPTDERAYRSVYQYDRARDPVGGRRFDTPWEEYLQPVFGSLAGRALDRLALTSFDDADGILAALDHCASPVAELVLDDSALDTRHVERLARHRVMAGVRRLSLQRVKLPSARALQRAGLEIVHSCRPAAPTYRYVVGME